MSLCRKCNTVNEESLTRCQACNAILPVKIGSKSETRWERVRRLPELVGMKCPSCGAPNPYTNQSCQVCGANLYMKPRHSPGLWVVVMAGIVATAVLITALKLLFR